MSTVYDVVPKDLIEKVTKALLDNEHIDPPAWAPYVKTGAHKERAPTQKDWWHRRCASILRKVYIFGPVGISRLKTAYGGRASRGVKPKRTYRGSGAIVRKAIQQLEKAKLIESVPGKGRKVTAEGRSFLDRMAFELNPPSEKTQKEKPKKPKKPKKK